MKNRNHGLSEKELVQLLMAVWEPWSVIPLIWKMPTPLLFSFFPQISLPGRELYLPYRH